jgi:hypothetical protein
VADTFVNSLSPDANFGSAGAMEVVAGTNPTGEFDSLLMFDLSGAVASFNALYGVGQWAVNGVTLSLGTNFGSQGAQPSSPFASINAGVFGVRWIQNHSWIEGTGNPVTPTTDGITFNTLSNYLSAADRSLGTFSWTAPGPPAPANVVGTYNLGLDPSFISDLGAGGKVSMEIVPADSGVGYLFNSRSYPTTANRPQLVVSATPVPEPGTAVLLLGGMVLLATRSRHLAAPAQNSGQRKRHY